LELILNYHQQYNLELILNYHQQYKTSYLLNYIKQLIIDMICENNISRGDRDCIHCISFPGRLFPLAQVLLTSYWLYLVGIYPFQTQKRAFLFLWWVCVYTIWRDTQHTNSFNSWLWHALIERFYTLQIKGKPCFIIFFIEKYFVYNFL